MKCLNILYFKQHSLRLEENPACTFVKVIELADSFLLLQFQRDDNKSQNTFRILQFSVIHLTLVIRFVPVWTFNW